MTACLLFKNESHAKSGRSRVHVPQYYCNIFFNILGLLLN